MSTVPIYDKKEFSEQAFKLVSDGFLVWSIIPLLGLVDIWYNSEKVVLVTGAVGLILFVLGLLWLYEGSKILDNTTPLVGGHLHTAVKHYSIALVLILVSPIFGSIIFAAAIVVALGLTLSALYHLYLYVSWLEEKMSIKQMANIIVFLIIIGFILSLKFMPASVEILGILMEAIGFLLLSTLSRRCMRTCSGS